MCQPIYMACLVNIIFPTGPYFCFFILKVNISLILNITLMFKNMWSHPRMNEHMYGKCLISIVSGNGKTWPSYFNKSKFSSKKPTIVSSPWRLQGEAAFLGYYFPKHVINGGSKFHIYEMQFNQKVFFQLWYLCHIVSIPLHGNYINLKDTHFF